jgi:anion-transporting  ArsA/GET3 family ATPase
VAKWFRDPAGKKGGLLGKVLQTGTRQVLKVLETLTGSNFIHELGDFFINIEQWQEQLLRRTVDVQKMMVAPSTHFCLVTSFDQAKLKEAEFFSKEIRKGGYHISAVVLNRVFPYWLNLTSDQTESSHQGIKKVYEEMRSYYLKKDRLYKNFESTIGKDVRVFRIPDLPHDISDLSGLNEVGKLLIEGEKKS